MEQLTALIRAFRPGCPQEERDRAELLRRLDSGEDLLGRDNLSAHLTASAWVTTPQRDRVLLAHHNLYNSRAWLGGHADGSADLARVALREVQEESGLTQLRLVSPEVYSLEILAVTGHEKRGEYVPSHLHLNVTFLVEADPEEPLQVKADENRRLAWFSPEEAVRASAEPWFRGRIYPKLNRRLTAFP